MDSTSFLIGLCVLLLVSSTEAKSRYMLNNTECTEEYLLRMDLVLAKLLGFGPNGRNFPENHQQLKGYCRETVNLVRQIQTYVNKCYVKDVRDLASIMIYSINKNIRMFCRRKSKKLDKLLANTACINRNFIKSDTCIMLYANNTKQLITQKVPDKDKIKYACCFYVDTLKCSEEVLESVPCIRKDKELMLDFVRGIFGSMVDLMCGDYNENTTRCEELQPLPKSRSPSRKLYNNFVFLMIDLLDTIKSFDIDKAKLR